MGIYPQRPVVKPAKKLTEPTGEPIIVYQNHAGSRINKEMSSENLTRFRDSAPSLIVSSNSHLITAVNIRKKLRWDFTRDFTSSIWHG